MWIVSSIIIPVLTGFFLIGFFDVVFFIRDCVRKRNESGYSINEVFTNTDFLKGLRDPDKINKYD
jgi:hypothetical protein